MVYIQKEGRSDGHGNQRIEREPKLVVFTVELTINVAELRKDATLKILDMVDTCFAAMRGWSVRTYVSLRSALGSEGGSLGEILLRGRAMRPRDVVRAPIEQTLIALSTSLRTPNERRRQFGIASR